MYNDQQQDQWVAKVHNLEDEVSMLKSKVIDAQNDRNFAQKKMDLLLSMKQREILMLTLKLEYAESDIEDFREYVDYLIRKLSAHNEKSGGECSRRKKGKRGTENNYMATTTKNERSSKILESELEKLKRDYEIFLSMDDPHVSGLLEDRDFAWSQFEKIRSDYTSFQQRQRVELEQANEKMEKLRIGMGQLESSNSEKDEIILKLKAELAKFDVTDESNRVNSSLSKEVPKLKISKAASLAPVLNFCKTRSQIRGVEKQKASMERSNTSQMKRLRGRDAREMPKPARLEVMSTSSQEHSVDLGASSAAPTNIEDEQVNKAVPTEEETVVPSKGHKRAKTSDTRQKTRKIPSPYAEKKDSADLNGRSQRNNGRKRRCK